MICLRATGWPVEIVGYGDRETGLCTVRLVGGPDDGKVFAGVHHSQLDGAMELNEAFYGQGSSRWFGPKDCSP